MSERVFQEVSVQEGYALWAASYDQEKNGLIFVEEQHVDRLPTVGYSRDDYLEAIRASGLTILEVTDILVGEAPEGYLPEEMLRMYADKPLSLSILAQKECAATIKKP